MKRSGVKAIVRMTACAASSKKYVVKCVVHKFSFRVRRQNSWRNCSKWKCLKFTKALLKLNLSHAILAHVQKSRFTQTIIQLIPLAHVSVCAAAACRPLSMNFRVKKSTSFRGTKINQHSWSMHCSLQKFQKLFWMKKQAKSRLLSQKSSYPLQLVAAVKTCVLQAS